MSRIYGAGTPSSSAASSRTSRPIPTSTQHRGASFLSAARHRGSLTVPGPSNTKISCPLEDFFAGNPFDGTQLVGNPNIKMTWRSIAAFVQNDWRVTPKFMLNLGLRYSYVSPIKEVQWLLGNFDPARGMVQQGQPSVAILSGSQSAKTSRLA